MPYIHFTEEQKLKANEVDLEEFLRLRGEKLIRSGHDKRLESDHSVTVRGNSWYDHAAERGGGPVSFLQRFYNMSYPEAMLSLLGGNNGLSYPAAPKQEPQQPKEFDLPEPNGDMRCVYAYLIKQRGIDKDVITHFARAGTLYEDAAPQLRIRRHGRGRNPAARAQTKYQQLRRGVPHQCGGLRSALLVPPHRKRWKPLCVRGAHRHDVLHHHAPGPLAGA